MNITLEVLIIIVLLINIMALYFIYRQNRRLKKGKTKGPRIVVVGGGTGQSMLLRGLKKYTENLTAIVTMADDGGSSGILREEMGMLPPGDIRNCILALSNAEPDMQKIMQYRFKEGSLKDQSFGNLFLAALNGTYEDFELAVTKISHILAVTGRVLPVTLENVNLSAELENGNIVIGESKIGPEVLDTKSKIKKISLVPENVEPYEEVISAIGMADLIIIGPGSLYTSIIPNLLTDRVSEAIEKSKAKKMYVSNIMTQRGETDNLDVYDHIEVLLEHCNNRKIIDMVIVNKEKIPEYLLKKYAEEYSESIYITKDQKTELEKRKIRIVEGNFLNLDGEYIRHNEEKLAKVIIDNYNYLFSNENHDVYNFYYVLRNYNYWRNIYYPFYHNLYSYFFHILYLYYYFFHSYLYNLIYHVNF